MKVFLALDGDVSPLERAEIAAGFGAECLVVALPAGRDPDELGADEIAELEGEALTVLREWFELWVAETIDDSWRRLERDLAGHLSSWRAQAPEAAPELRAAVCARFG
jgi:hypothetical protein